MIPTYNRQHLVVEAIASARAQDYPVREVLVVDDGSTDETVARLAASGPPVEVIRLAHSGCPGRVRNAGIRRAQGELVSFLDADDLWLPGKLSCQVDLLRARPELGAVYTNEYFEEGGRRLPSTRFDGFPPVSACCSRSGWRGSALRCRAS